MKFEVTAPYPSYVAGGSTVSAKGNRNPFAMRQAASRRPPGGNASKRSGLKCIRFSRAGMLEKLKACAAVAAAAAAAAAIVRQQVDEHGLLWGSEDSKFSLNKPPHFTQFELVVADSTGATDGVRFFRVKS